MPFIWEMPLIIEGDYSTRKSVGKDGRCSPFGNLEYEE
jgi:hypothetical protein